MLYDFDWDVCLWLEQHPQFGAGILLERGHLEVMVRVVLSHGNHTVVPIDSLIERLMENAIFAKGELLGFVAASALVRPTKPCLIPTPW